MYDLSKKEQDYAMFGLLLGDGAYDKCGRFQVVHSNKQRDYIVWLERICKRWGVSHSVNYDRTYTSRGSAREYSYIRMSFNDRTRVEKYSRFFVDGKKIASKYATKRMTPLSWLFLWLDDGCLSVHWDGKYSVGRRAVLHTNNLDKKSNENLVASLEGFGVSANVKTRNNGEYYMLTMSANPFRRFIDTVRPYLQYVPQSLLYKFDMQYQGTRNEDLLKYNSHYYLQARGSASHPN